jgi:hypothetical protein
MTHRPLRAVAVHRAAAALTVALFVAVLLVPADAEAWWGSRPGRVAASAPPAPSPTPAPPRSAARTLLPEALGPFELKSRDGNWSLRPGLTAQLRFTLTSVAGSGVDDPLDSYVEARRIRPTLAGALFNKDLRYLLHLSTAPGSVELMDWYLDYRFGDGVRARVGQWKIPFTRYRMGSYKHLTLTDWPVAPKYFGAERQMGLCLHNGYGSGAPLAYEVGIFTGTNARAAHGVGLSRVYGQTPANPSDLIDPGPRASLHPELVAHLAYNHNGIDPRRDTDFAGGDLRLSVGLSAAWDLDPVVSEDLALRLAPELLLKYGGASLFGAFYLGFDRAAGADADVLDQQLAMLGGVVQASYFFAGQLEVSARWSMVVVDAGLLAAARTRAAVTNLLTPGALSPHAGTLQREEERGVGFNVYLIGTSLKWQTDLTWLLAAHVDGATRHQLRLRTQLHLAF